MRFLAIVADINTVKELNRSETFYVKIIEPDGTISRNWKKSPVGFTGKYYKYIINNDEYYTLGWGNPDYSVYDSGKYTVEIYHASSEDPINEKMLIASKPFQLY